MQMIVRAALSSQKMRCASHTWRVKTAVWSYGVTYSLSPPRGRKATCPYTEHGTGVYACLSAVHRRWGTHARKRRRRKRKFSWQSALVVTESDVHWSAARGAENHRHERRNLRSHHPCMQMPWPWGMPLRSLPFFASWLSPVPFRANRGLLISSDLQQAQTFIGPLFYSR